MNTTTKTAALLWFASFALPGLAQSDESSSCAARPGSSLERKVDHEAMKGPTTLRRFVMRTQVIYQLDYATEATRFSVARDGERACEARRTAAPSVASR